MQRRWARWMAALALAAGLCADMALRAQPVEAVRLTAPVAVQAEGAAVGLRLALSRATAWRAGLWSDPPRAVLELEGLDTAGPALPDGRLRIGPAGEGWARLVLDLDQPMGWEALAMTLDRATGAARLEGRLVPVDAAEFRRQARALGGEAAPGTATAAPAPPRADRLVVVLDPGHGGLDPGASHGDLTESALTLTFARELAAALTAAEGFDVHLTRTEDRFVGLEARISRARAAGAQVFLSLHADALADGEATGVTLYTLAAAASEAASAALAERHDRADLLGGGADLSTVEDEVALVLMDIARTETRPRTDRLVQALIGAIRGAGLAMHPRPWQEAAFSVLKAPDIPSILIELGFLSSQSDRARLTDPAWRARLIAAIIAALERWRDDEAGRALLRRR